MFTSGKRGKSGKQVDSLCAVSIMYHILALTWTCFIPLPSFHYVYNVRGGTCAARQHVHKKPGREWEPPPFIDEDLIYHFVPSIFKGDWYRARGAAKKRRATSSWIIAGATLGWEEFPCYIVVSSAGCSIYIPLSPSSFPLSHLFSALHLLLFFLRFLLLSSLLFFCFSICLRVRVPFFNSFRNFNTLFFLVHFLYIFGEEASQWA